MIRRSPIFTLFPYTTLFRSQGSGTYGAEIYWYDAAVDGNIIGFGEEFTTNEIIQTESYWVSEVFLEDRKSTRLNSSHVAISYAVFCLKKKKRTKNSHKIN